MLGYLFSGLFTFFLVMHQRKQAALEAIQLNLIAIQSATQHAVDIATGTSSLATNVGALTCEANVDHNVQTFVTSTLSIPDVAGNAWLQVAAFAQGSGYPILANSIAGLGSQKIHNGDITTP